MILSRIRFLITPLLSASVALWSKHRIRHVERWWWWVGWGRMVHPLGSSQSSNRRVRVLVCPFSRTFHTFAEWSAVYPTCFPLVDIQLISAIINYNYVSLRRAFNPQSEDSLRMCHGHDENLIAQQNRRLQRVVCLSLESLWQPRAGSPAPIMPVTVALTEACDWL